MAEFKVVTRKDTLSEKIADHVIKELTLHGFHYNQEQPEFIISIGGDGTFLNAVHSHLNSINEVKFVGIHTGTLGFFTQYSIDQVQDCIQDLLTKTPIIQTASLIEVVLNDDKKHKLYALNEMRVENIIKTQIMDIYINDEYFEIYRGTGICVSTQFGSTAYNRSIGGTVVQNGFEVLQMTEIAGIHHRAYQSLGSPILLKPETVIRFESKSFDGALLCYDYLNEPLDHIQHITCRLSDKRIHIATYKEDDFFAKLRNLF